MAKTAATAYVVVESRGRLSLVQLPVSIGPKAGTVQRHEAFDYRTVVPLDEIRLTPEAAIARFANGKRLDADLYREKARRAVELAEMAERLGSRE